jgi:hypothetical protein
VGADAYEALARAAHARPMGFTGRPLKGFLYVAAQGLESDADLRRWVGHGLRHATSLPAKRERAPLARGRAPKPHPAPRRPTRSQAPRRSASRRTR